MKATITELRRVLADTPRVPGWTLLDAWQVQVSWDSGFGYYLPELQAWVLPFVNASLAEQRCRNLALAMGQGGLTYPDDTVYERGIVCSRCQRTFHQTYYQRATLQSVQPVRLVCAVCAFEARHETQI